MKRTFTLSIIILLSNIIYSQTATPPSAGDGTAGNPLQISSLDNLYWISQNPTFWDVYYIQTADIDASETATWFDGSGFIPIGTYTSNPFAGNYNGNEHVISNLTINKNINGAALFSCISSTAEISNLGMENVSTTITTKDDSYDDCGALIGWNFGGTVTNCYSTGNIIGDSYVGGLIGSSDTGSLITNCYSTCTVNGYERIGGLIGWSWCTVENSYALGNVSGDNTVGGFIGQMASGSINSCYSTGNVSANSYAGGFTDSVDGTISNCYSWGNVTRNEGNTNTNFGSFTDYVGSNSAIQYCYATGAVIYDNATNPTDRGFAAVEETNITYTSNYFDYTTTGQSSGLGATPKLTTQLHTLSTFTSTGWDFTCEITNGNSDYWGINSDENSGYPFLVFQGYAYDTEKPTIGCVGSQTVNADGTHYYTVQGTEFDPIETFDNCGISSVVNTFNNTSTLANAQLPEGTTTIVWTITDNSGNTNKCSSTITVDSTAAIADFDNDYLIVYPNPVSNELYIEFEGNTKNLNFEIFNSIGQIVYKGNILEKTTVNTTNFTSGLYILKVDKGNTFGFKKILKE